MPFCKTKPEEGRGRITKCHLYPAILLLPLLLSCSSARKISRIERDGVEPVLSLPAKNSLKQIANDSKGPVRDTLKVTGFDGREVLVMRAIKDDESGEMVATEELTAAVVTARFRNVAERRGRIALEFLITVPAGLQDKGWQLRFHPLMNVLGDSLELDDVLITGNEYRRQQMRGYQRYGRYYGSIIRDSLHFLDERSLRIFLERNGRDGTCDVSLTEAGDHYTRHLAKRINRYRESLLDQKWQRFVKSPIVTEGIRLDTVMLSSEGDFIYAYVQEIATRPSLRKVELSISGEIFQSDRRLYSIPESEPLTFYISSLSSFADRSERYLTRIISRNARATDCCRLDFRTGSSTLEEEFSNNFDEMSRIRGNLRMFLSDSTYQMDSIVVEASASPEGDFFRNRLLSERRAEAVGSYFGRYVKYLRDSIRMSGGVFLDYDTGKASEASVADVTFITRSGGENWQGLDTLVQRDTLFLTPKDKCRYLEIRGEGNADQRERLLSREMFYESLKEKYYPLLRTVRFDFHLHRRGMIKDTVHTTVLDTVYMNGVRFLEEHDYQKALHLLYPYGDYNTAVAFLAMDYNASALSILKDLKRDARVEYLLAVLYSRLGDERSAVECYLRSCSLEPSYEHRGNLDPEISTLINKYQLVF